jgi:hypothetical protein
VYSHHGGAFDNGLHCEQNSAGDEVLNFVEKHSIVHFDNGSADFSTLHYPPDNPDKKILLAYELMDAATTNIFVMDERVTDYASNQVIDKFRLNGVKLPDVAGKNWLMYAANKVFVTHQITNGEMQPCNIGEKQSENKCLICAITYHKLADGSINMAKSKIEFSTKIRNFTTANSLRKDVLIIHRTYIDEVKVGINAEEFLALAKKEFGTVIVTSGGGKPHNLKADCKFIPFSQIEACISTRVAKNKLNNLVQTNIK